MKEQNKTKKLNKSKNINITEGPILKNCLLFALPLIATGILQLLYNAADLVVVARFAGGNSLAAVGACTSIINLLVNLFLGLSTGANVVIARHYGAKNNNAVFETVHTAVLLSVIAGVVIMITGISLASFMLNITSCPKEVFSQAKIYIIIYMLGIPASSVYNFCAAILRSVGNTKKPLFILILSGLINIALNLILVIVFHLDVAGVAIATSVSQVVSAALAVTALIKTNDSFKLYINKLKLYKDKVLDILRFGVPAGIQASIFSLSNIVIQSSINSFGAAAIAGSAAASNIEGLTYTVMNSISQTCITFVSQNFGAQNKKRINRSFRSCIFLVVAGGMLLSAITLLFDNELLSLFTAAGGTESDIPAEVIINYGVERLKYVVTVYFLCGLMDVISGAERGLGVSLLPTVVALVFTCGFRLLWVFTVFDLFSRTLSTLFLSYPISWTITGIVHYICLIFIRKKQFAKLPDEIAEQ